MTKVRVVLLLLLGGVFGIGFVMSQVLTGTISGTVSDPSRAVVPGASLTIVNEDTGATVWRGTTNESGVYRAPQLPVGRYTVGVQMEGFKRADISGINLTVDQRAAVNVTLEPGGLNETITVEGEALGRLATESSALGNTINMSQVQDLPMPDRNILNLLSLSTGISSGGDATGINANQLSINGSRTLNSEFTVNGVSVVSGSTGGVQTLPPTDAIREVNVLTSGYSAEYGRSSGAIITMVTNSGTDEYHGGLYYYFRNESLNANNFFNNVRGESRPQDRYNLFGGKLGGPLSIPKLYSGRKKTFFFFNYEGLRRANPYANLSSVPDAAFRAGDFSASPIPIYQPGTTMQFPGNRVPASMIDPAAAKIMSLLPLPNSPGSPDAANGRTVNNYVQVGSTKPTNNKATVRVDENISEKSRVFLSLNHYRSVSQGDPIIPGPLENSTGPSRTTGYHLSLGYSQTWTPTFFTEMRFGFFRNNSQIVPPSLGLNVQNVLGIQRSVGPAAPRFDISGWRQLGLNSNTLRSQIDNNFQPSIAASKVWGNHLVKFGWDLRKNQFNIYNPGGTGTSGFFTGSYTFNGEITSATRNSGNPINALADFLLGAVKNSGYSLPQPPAGRRNSNTALYVQDDWKATRRLTLNLGMRYEYESPMTSSNRIYSRVDPNTGKVLFAGINASDSLNLSGDKINFAPRVGFAYSVTPKTVVRSAFGMFYTGIFSNLGAQVLFPGYTVTQSFTNLGTGIAQPFPLSQGMPLIAVQNLKDPQSTLSQFNASNPISASASFAEAGPVPYSNEWNFGVQRELLYGVILDTNYVGSSGVHLQLNLPNNQVPFAAATDLAFVNQAVVTQNARPFPHVGQFSAVRMAGHSSYHALQVSARRQSAANLAFVANYTWSKSINDGDGLFSFSQPTGLNVGQFPTLFRNLDRAVSEFHRPHAFTAAIQYRTSGPRWLRGFELNPILTARDGLRTTINQNNLNSAASQLRPNVVSTASLYLPKPVANGIGLQYLVPANDPGFPLGPVGPLFTGTGANRTLVLPAGIGTLGRNSVRTPGEFNLDLAVSRKFPIRERAKFTIRAEAFNVLNHTNLMPPNVSLTATVDPRTGQAVFNSPSFGLITSARDARFMQLVARFEF